MANKEQKTLALNHFKDWSNYLLVTTVASLGWVAQAPDKSYLLKLTIILFGISVIFAIFTLALIPLVAEKIDEKPDSIYHINPKVKPFWFWGPSFPIVLQTVCWPPHITFILGIIFFVIHSFKL